MNASLPIGAIAERTGLTVSTIRYYDEIGVIDSTERVGGKRRFAESTVGRVEFIRRARRAGFSLDEIRAILDDTRGDWRAIVDTKIVDLNDRRRELDGMLALLSEVRDCGCDVVATCVTGAAPHRR